MSDEFTEVTHTSWFKRIINSFVGILVGIVMFLGAFPAIWWNEGRSVDRIKTLDEGRGAVVAVQAAKVDAANDGALIHISGTATSNEIVEDALFGVKENALELSRTVEIYQWRQNSKTVTEKKLGGGETKRTTYSYEKTWAQSLINSTNFKKPEGHTNPTNMPYKSQSFAVKKVNLEAFELSSAFSGQISNSQDYTLTQANFDAMDDATKQLFKLNGNEYFAGDPNNPAIGAMRVKYRVTKPAEVSVVGKQNNGIVETYFTKTGELKLLTMGKVSAEEMFKTSESSNSMLTWALRVGAFILMWTGLSAVFAPIRVMGDVVPFIGSILGAGIGLVTGVVVSGTAKVTCADKTFILEENQSTYIPLGTIHSLENPNKTPLELIEVQTGTYLAEDDIIRFDDKYGRT